MNQLDKMSVQHGMITTIARLICCLALFMSCTSRPAEGQIEKIAKTIQDGDIIFHTSKSAQSKAIQLATGSKYSHMGIIYRNRGQFFVYEAIQPVQLTPIEQWIARGEGERYVVKRLKQADVLLTPQVLLKMKQVGERFSGKSYDVYFEWSDEKIYCSELVWKIYQEAVNIEIGQLEQLADFDLSSEVVQAKMKERYGSDIPWNEKVISPAAMFDASNLETVLKSE